MAGAVKEWRIVKMAIRKSILVMSNTGTSWNKISEPVRGNAYYSYTDGLHTVQIIYANFVGGFGIQGTLALDPCPEDWFWISLNQERSIHQSILRVLSSF